MRQFTSEERIRRVWDKEEAKAVLCRHAYLEAANRRAESLSQLWVAEPEHQATASYGKNWGYYVGMDAIRSYYVDRNPIGGVGTNICHPVATICIGQAASMGAFLLAGGEKGMRYALPHSRIMIHQPSAGYQGQVTDIDIHAREVLRMKASLNEMLAENTGRPLDKVAADTERDYFMTAEEALEYGIIDRIFVSRRDMTQGETGAGE